MEKKRILVVDDDRTVIESLKGILESEGYSVDTAERGRQALARFDSAPYDLVLLDAKLPDVEGTKLLGPLRDRFPEMVRIITTSHPTLSKAVDSGNIRADAYIIKPVDPSRLLKVVKERLPQKEEARDSSREEMKQPDKRQEEPSESGKEEKKPASVREEKKQMDEMMQSALSLLKNEGNQKKPMNSRRVKAAESKKAETKKTKDPVQEPQSPEQDFWLSLANLDVKSVGLVSEKKQEVNASRR
jgi:DNA-binding NtrC family response regulator